MLTQWQPPWRDGNGHGAKLVGLILLLSNHPLRNVSFSMLRSTDTRANTISATMEIGQLEDDRESGKDSHRLNLSAPEPSHTQGSLESRSLHAPISGFTC